MIKPKRHAQVLLAICGPAQTQPHLYWLIARKLYNLLCFRHISDFLLFWVQYQVLLQESGGIRARAAGNQLQTNGWT
jgi:hypothetical protein